MIIRSTLVAVSILLFITSNSATFAQNFGEEHLITDSVDYVESIYVIDIDGDGDQDVLSASVYDDKIAWYENIDGNGSFGDPNLVTTCSTSPDVVRAVDIDTDGDQDVLSAYGQEDKIVWYEHTTTVIKTIVQNEISICSNPTDGKVKLDFAQNNVQQITVSDISGKVLIKKTCVKQIEIIDLSAYKYGIYIICFQTEKETFSRKIVKD